MRMRKEPFAAVLTVLVGIAATGASAAFFQQKEKSAVSDTDLYEPSQWDQNREPADGDTIQLPGYASSKRFYLSSSKTNVFPVLYFKSGHAAAAQGGSSLCFDTAGHEFLMPRFSSVYKAQFLWQTYVPAGQNVASADYNLAEFTRSSPSNRAPVLMRDFRFTYSTDPTYASEIRFERGEFNAFDPDPAVGAEADGTDVYTLKIGLDSTIPTRVVWCPDAVFRLPRFEIERGKVESVVNGAKIAVDGSFTQRGSTVVSNGAEITVGHLGGTGAGAFNHNAGSFMIRDAATVLKAKGNYTSHGGVFTNDGAVVTIEGNMTQKAGYVQTGGATLVAGNYYAESADALLHLLDGKFSIAGSYGIYTSMGSVKVDGGVLSVDRIRNSGSGSLSIIQTGGDIMIGGNTRPGVWACESGSETFRMELAGGTFSTPLIRGIKPGATLSADGGRLLATVNAPADTTDNVPFLSGFDTVAVGEEGLQIDTDRYSVSVEQNIVNIDGERGAVVKKGSGTLMYCGRLAASKLSVERGVFGVAGASTSIEAATAVEDATISLIGDVTELTLPSLALTNAVIALDPGDVITVTGDFAVKNLSLHWSSAPTAPQEFLAVNGRLSAAASDELAKTALFGGAAGTHAVTSAVYDESTGKTVLSAAVVPDAPLTSRIRWNGLGNIWQVADNWEGGRVPTAEDIAVFDATDGASTVIVRDGDTAGALSFVDGAYVIDGAGGALRLYGAAGSARIDAAKGEHEIACDLDLAAVTAVEPAQGASVRISGAVRDGGIDKLGKGRLTLAGEVFTRHGVTVRDGMLSVEGSGEFGRTERDSLTLEGGTLEIAGPGSISVSGAAAVKAEDAQRSVVVKSEGDVSFDSFSAETGFLVKRGIGSMTVNVPAATTVKLSASASPIGQGDHHTADAGINFPADGSEPTGMRGPLSVVEGELRIVGQGPGARAEAPGTVYVSVPTPHALGAQPSLTLDNVELSCVSLHNGWCLGRPAFSARSSTVRVLNGSTLSWTDSMPGYACTADGCFATYAATNSTLKYVADNAYLSRGRIDDAAKTTPIVRYFLSGSEFEVGQTMTLDGSVYIDLDNASRYGRPDGKVTSFAYGTPARVYGEIFTRNGSCLALGEVREVSGQTRDLTLAFDGGEWQWADDRGSRTLSPSAYGYVRWEMRGRGAVLRPAAGATLTVAAPFEGEGGIVVDGEGTVSFTAGAYAFAGVSDVRKGTLDLSSAGNLTGASFAGDGTVKGARVDAVVLCARLSDSWENTNGVPVLLDCEFTGTVTVTAGRAADDRLQLPSEQRPTPIAKIAGSTRIDLSRWMLEKKAAHDATGVFTLDGDTVYLTPCNLPGLVMIVR